MKTGLACHCYGYPSRSNWNWDWKGTSSKSQSPPNAIRFSTRRRASSLPLIMCSCLSSSSHGVSSLTSLRCAVLGAGFAGLSVAWHLLRNSPKELGIHVDIIDEFGIAGGASGVAGGLLHPYSPKVKLLWKGQECWRECLNLLNVAEVTRNSTAGIGDPPCTQTTGEYFIRRRGLLRPATNEKNLDVMRENAQNCLASCRIETVDKVAAKDLVPYICAPLNTAFYMPEAVNVNPLKYLEALFLACGNFVKKMSSTGFDGKSISLCKKFVASLHELEGKYDAVVICLGARVDMIPELSGMLPLRTCRGIVADLQMLDAFGECYPDHSPSILSDAWIAAQGPRSLSLGSTWEWGSKNYSVFVSPEEASRTLQELLPKACAIYPQLASWTLMGARAGLRAMPPLTPHGSFPLLGCIDDLVGECGSSKYWLIGGLGSRGLLYHGWLGKLTAQAMLSCDESIIPSELTSWRKMRGPVTRRCASLTT